MKKGERDKGKSFKNQNNNNNTINTALLIGTLFFVLF